MPAASSTRLPKADAPTEPRQQTGGGPAAGPSLLTARTSPPLSSSGTVARPSLLRLLDDAFGHRLTVVSGGPGWGKTTAVATWAAARPDDTVAWLTLEPQDDTPAYFWTDVIQALILSGAVPEENPLRGLNPAGVMSSDLLRSLARGLESLPRPLLLVLDDFQLIENPDVLEGIESLVRYELPVRLVLVTRIDPPLHLHRLRLTGDLAEVTAADLAFGPDDVSALAEDQPFELTGEDVGLILSRTEGWPAGVRLAMIYLRRAGADRGLSGFAGEDRSVAEYLVAEVLDHQPDGVRDFLLRTSVVSPVSAGLAEALAPGRPALPVLEGLVRSHQFVAALGPDGQWFRYHPLLREMLVGLLRKDDPEGFRIANRRAARWLGEHGEPLRALRHAAAAADWWLFAALFVQSAGPSLIGQEREAVATLLEGVPDRDVPPSAAVELCAAALAVIRGRFVAARAHVGRARALEPATPPELRPPVGALIEIFDAATARAEGDMPRLVRSGRAALQLLDSAPRPFPAMPGYRQVAANNVGVGLLWTGDVEGAREVFAEVLGDPVSSVTLASLNARAHLAMCDVVECRLDEAERRAVEALDVAASRGWSMHLQLRLAHVALAMVRVLRGDHDGADLALASALAAKVGGNETAAVLAARLVQVFVSVSRGRLRAAGHALQVAEDTSSGWAPGPYLADQLRRATAEVGVLAAAQGEPLLREPGTDPAATPTELVCRARMLLAAGDAAAAGEAAEAVTTSGSDPGVVDGELVTLVEAWLVRALSAYRLRRDSEALHALDRAVELARPEGLVRPFEVMGDDRLSGLLRLTGSVGDSDDEFTRRLVEQVIGAVDAEIEPEPLLVPLTDRELAMLAALPSMQSNAEIAADFFVSVNTVKAHLKALYRKLGVGSRREAVRRGRELGLLH
ncbi:MAG TPA: LuxR C-terminal-related transcriptional regulator [Jiangellales bacterium]|nr:LuxR C-terminal-related transcriptional regulator [Jiangellales bacterium]